MVKRLIWLLLIASASAQQTDFLLPIAKVQFFSANGITPDAFGKVCTYQAGTTTPLQTFTDYAGGTPNTNPTILDAAGRASIWLAGQAYKVILQDATGTANTCDGQIIWTADNITGVGGLTGANYTVTGVWTFYGGGQNFNVTNNNGNAIVNINAAASGITSVINVEAVVSNGNNGEFQLQIADATPFGWRFCATHGGNTCPFKVAGGAPDGLVDIGGTNVDEVTQTFGTGDTGYILHAVNGGTDTTAEVRAVVSNAHTGEMQFRLKNVSPYAWEFNETNAAVTPVTFFAQAPANSLVLNNDGTISIPAGVKTNTAGNTDQAGTCILGTSCGPARTFAATYVSAPICVATDQTSAAAVKAVVSTTTLTLTGTGTDTLDYVCFPRN